MTVRASDEKSFYHYWGSLKNCKSTFYEITIEKRLVLSGCGAGIGPQCTGVGYHGKILKTISSAGTE